MKRALFVCLIMFIGCVFLTGCWSQRELNELSIAFALGLDIVDGQYVVTAQIINPGELSPARSGGGGDQAPVATYETKGATLFEAFRRMTKKVPRKVYFAYVRIVVIGEALAKEGILEALDFFLREDEFRTDFYFLVAKGSRAGDTLRVLTIQNPIPAEKMFGSLEMSEQFWAATGKITIDELVSDLIEGGRHPVITGIEVTGNEANAGSAENMQNIRNYTGLKLADMVAFHGDKMAGWLDEQESKGYNYTQNKVHDTITTVPCPEEGKLAVEIRRSEAEIRTEVTNGRPRGRIHVRAEGNIGDVECDIDLSKEQTVLTLEKRTREKIREAIAGSLHKAQEELRTDIFGFGDALSRSEPSTWVSLKHDWTDIFSDMSVDIAVDVDMRAQGSMTKSIKEIMEERR